MSVFSFFKSEIATIVAWLFFTNQSNICINVCPLFPAPIIPTLTLSIFGVVSPKAVPLAVLLSNEFVFSKVSSLQEIVVDKPKNRAAFDESDKKSFLFIIKKCLVDFKLLIVKVLIYHYFC